MRMMRSLLGGRLFSTSLITRLNKWGFSSPCSCVTCRVASFHALQRGCQKYNLRLSVTIEARCRSPFSSSEQAVSSATCISEQTILGDTRCGQNMNLLPSRRMTDPISIIETMGGFKLCTGGELGRLKEVE